MLSSLTVFTLCSRFGPGGAVRGGSRKRRSTARAACAVARILQAAHQPAATHFLCLTNPMRSFLAATSERSADSSCRQWHSQPPRAAVISKACEDAAAVSKAYQDEVNQRRRAAMERAAAAEQDTAALARRSAFKLDVREASGLCVAECRAEYRVGGLSPPHEFRRSSSH
jgi:hypothetical protein